MYRAAVGGLLALAMALAPGCTRPAASSPAPVENPAPPAPTSAPIEPPAQEAVVASAMGPVERLRGRAWSPVAKGDRVQAEDALRTGATGRADLEVGARARISVAEDTQVKVAELTDAVHRFHLTRGRVRADYEPDGQRVLRIEGAQAVAEATSAQFSALSTPGAFAVSAEIGSVDLRAAGEAVRVQAGEQSVVRDGRAPSPAAPLARSLLLKVALARGAGAPCAALEGVATPGAELLVDGDPAPLDASGRFRVETPPGRREIEVVVRDASGRRERQRVRCVAPALPAPTSARIEEMKIRWRE